MRYLGIDYGAKRVGLSLSDEEGKIAFPFKIISNNLELVDTIHNICGEEEISAIVLGESTDISGKPNKIMGSIEEFKRNLEGELDLPIYFEKEFMTSIFARGNEGKKENNARKSKKEKAVKIDDSAAALILQRYLDRKNLKI
ncbi:MAG: Holliday junction resolvase RuvX [Candidatus Pacebacteria bacterium]|nr:Holliday junction resolvase RuvX [Candidatus Paceibacterota bacterium]